MKDSINHIALISTCPEGAELFTSHRDGTVGWRLVHPPDPKEASILVYACFLIQREYPFRSGFLYISVTVGLPAFQGGLSLEWIPACSNKAAIRKFALSCFLTASHLLQV